MSTRKPLSAAGRAAAVERTRKWRKATNYGRNRPAGMTTAQRFLANVLIAPSGCWLWQGYCTKDGYGRFSSRAAHRVAYELSGKTIPEGLEIDHLCRVRHCVNPSHLEAVSHRENTLRGETVAAIAARKTHCLHGHAFDESNTRVGASGRRHCRACARERSRRYKARKQAA